MTLPPDWPAAPSGYGWTKPLGTAPGFGWLESDGDGRTVARVCPCHGWYASEPGGREFARGDETGPEGARLALAALREHGVIRDEPAADRPRCATCRHWWPPEPPKSGTCRIEAPTRDGWPVAWEDDGCSRHSGVGPSAAVQTDAAWTIAHDAPGGSDGT